MTTATNGRSIFSADVDLGRGRKHYRIFAMEKGLLFLEIKVSGTEGKGNGLIWAAIFGGAVGALAASLARRNDKLYETEFRYDAWNDADLFQAARTLKGSFVSLFDEMQRVSIVTPSLLSGLVNRSVAIVHIRDAKLGKFCLELSDPPSVATAVDVFGRLAPDRVAIRVELDPHTMEYRTKR